MKLGSLTALRLMWEYMNGQRRPRPRVSETVLFRSPMGHPWLLYSGKHASRTPLILVHGVTARASEDINLVHLARCIADLGHPCLTPPLDGLAHFSHDEADVATVVDALHRARELFGRPASVWGFSYGASYALSAAARAECRSCCRFIVAFGAYYELDAALEHQRKQLVAQPEPDSDDVDLLYLRYTLLLCQRETIQLPEPAWSEIESTLSNFMTPGPLEERWRPLLEYARDIDYAELMALYQRRPRSGALSPAGKLEGLACPVALLHDPNDRFIPSDQTRSIQNELDCRQGVPKTQTLTTRMLSHVQVNPMRSLLDAYRLIRLLSPLFE